MRAFVGIPIDPTTVANICAIAVQLGDRIPGIRWIAQDNIHLTLKFLGEIDEPRIEPIGGALQEAVRPFSRFTINAKGLGVFPGLKRPQVVWVGLQGPPLVSLAAAIEGALEPLGFAKEVRAFRPHLTIGRWRQFPGSGARLGRELERWQEHEFGKSLVDEIVLFHSILKPAGAVYRPLRTIVLNGESAHSSGGTQGGE